MVSRALLAVLLLIAVVAAAPAAASARDLVVITGGATVRPGESVGTVVVIDGPVRIAGRVREDVVSVSGPVTVTGTIGGDLVTVANQARLAPGARVGGDLTYADERPVIAPGASVAGDVSKENWGDIRGGLRFVGLFVWWLGVTVATLVIGLVALALAPRAADAVERTARGSPGPAIAWGVGLLILLPLIAVLIMITIIGIPLGLLLLVALVPLFALAYVTSAWVLGRIIVGPPRGRTLAFLAGLAILRLLALIPFLGAVVGLAATAFGLGALFTALLRARAAPAPSAGATVPAPPPTPPEPAAG